MTAEAADRTERQVIETEAPIIHDLLCRRVLRAINIARMGVRVSSRMQTIINSMNLKETEETDPVYWKDSQDPDTYSLLSLIDKSDPERISLA